MKPEELLRKKAHSKLIRPAIKDDKATESALNGILSGKQIETDFPFDPRDTMTTKESQVVKDTSGKPVEVSRVTI